MANRLTADASLDLDNKWAYLRTHGDQSWVDLPSYLPYVVPRILKILEEVQLKITVFVVGQDAAVEVNRDPLFSIAAAGHEIANHSYNHFPWLQRLSHSQLQEELEQTEAILAQFAQRPLVGFRAPGYSISAAVLSLLARRGYLYDCSTLPTYLGPAARAYYLLKSSFSREEANDRKDLFGSFADGFRSLRPYLWTTEFGEVLEMPVSTIPIVRTPFHFSYLHYLAQVSPMLAKSYFATALNLCRATRVAPSLLLHPLDFLGGDEVPELAFFPGMKLKGADKRRFMTEALAKYADLFEVVPMEARAKKILAQSAKLRRFEKLPHMETLVDDRGDYLDPSLPSNEAKPKALEEAASGQAAEVL